MAQYIAFDPQAEATGLSLGIVDGLKKFSQIFTLLLVRNGFDPEVREEWYPMQQFLNVYRDINETFGSATMFYVGMRTMDEVAWPPELDSWQKALSSVDMAYKMNTQGNGGSYLFEPVSDTYVRMVCHNPWPSDYDLGLLKGICNNFPVSGHKILIRLDESQPNRKTGGDTCVYEIELVKDQQTSGEQVDSYLPWAVDQQALTEEVLSEAYGVLNTQLVAMQQVQDELKESNHQLESANDTKDKFFSIISHDLWGPVGSLSVVLNEVASRGADIDDELFQSMASSAKSTEQLLENLLTWARGQKGEIEFHPTHFGIGESIQQNLDLFEGPAQQKSILFSKHVDRNLFVYADFDMVRATIRNLINNAVKFTPSGGNITVSAHLIGGVAQVEVLDSGVGVEKGLQSALFNLDDKVRSSLGTNSEAGSGLGLVLCSEFVKKQGGEIGVESTVGSGSRFWFTLPLGQETQARSQAQEQQLLKRLTAMRVLVAEDNDLHRETTTSVLRDLGVPFETVKNGVEAVQRCQFRPFDLVLMDIDMPLMNGVQANQEIRAQLDNPPAIMALSSYSKTELNRLADESPFDGYLNKPLDKDRFLKNLQLLLA